MSAELLGGRLLGEVEEQTLDELLREIKEIANPRPSSQLGIRPLDNLIDLFCHPQHQQASPKRPSWATRGRVFHDDEEIQYQPPSLDRHPEGQTLVTPKSKPPVIELTSSHSASGKTSLLYQLASCSVVTKAYGENQATVVWVDADGRFSASRLSRIIDQFIRSQRPRISTRECEILMREATSHVHVFGPQSSAQLISTLTSLPEYLLSPTQHNSQPRQLGILILDSATAFHWPDRSDAELQHLTDHSTTPAASTRKSKTSSTISLLRSLQRTFDCTILFTTDQSLHPKPSQQAEPAFISPWTSFATLSLTFNRAAVPQFAPDMAVEECARDQPRRMEAVARGRFRVNVAWTGSEGGGSGIVDAVSRLDGGGEFSLTVTAEGVHL